MKGEVGLLRREGEKTRRVGMSSRWELDTIRAAESIFRGTLVDFASLI